MNIYDSLSGQFIVWEMSAVCVRRVFIVDIGRVSATVVMVLSAMGVGRMYTAGRWDV